MLHSGNPIPTDIGSVVEAELWAIHDGLNFEWDMGFRGVMVPGMSIIPYNVVLCARDWEVVFRSVRRMGNKVADSLAKRGLIGVMEGELLITPPGELMFVLDEDSG
ncbi:hypothetical protein GQ457_07G022970 [Hibiscus cannabinus]